MAHLFRKFRNNLKVLRHCEVPQKVNENDIGRIKLIWSVPHVWKMK